ncbi:MAG: DUF4832 domain-containing protein [Lentisphaerae bacterium]|nr:DUF4832 domain-containing protein [Lentisphaerota bacterium]
MRSILPLLSDQEILCNRGCGINYCQRRKKIPFESVPADTWFLKEKLCDKIAIDISWSQLEPNEGEFLWEQPEWEGCFKSWMDAGFKILLKVRGMDTLGTFYNQGTPQWVFDAGARYVDEDIALYRNSWLLNNIPENERKPIRYPVYWDEIYLEKVNHLLQTMGQRYNGSPMIESVAIAHMGRWGEMHIADHYNHDTWIREGFSIANFNQAHRAIIDMYRAAFPNTPLQQSIGAPCFDIATIADAAPNLEYLAQNGIMIKIGGLGKAWLENASSPWLDREEHELFKRIKYQTKLMAENLVLPQALDFALDLGLSYWQRGGEANGLGELNIDKDIPIGEKKIYSFYKFYPEAYDRLSLEDQKNIWRHMAQHTGYRIAAEAVDTEVKDQNLVTVFFWNNRGAAPCYEKFEICVALFGKDGQKVWSASQKPSCGCSPKIWDSKSHFSDMQSWKLPLLPEGEYELYFGVRQNRFAGEMMMLANAGRTIDGMYPAGKINIKKNEQRTQ